MKTKAAVLLETGKPFEIMELDLDGPGPGEVLIKYTAAGLCHSDLHFMEGKWATELPVVMGHESAGIVEAAISLIALEHQLLPGTLNLRVPDLACGPQIQRDNVQRKARHALSFSFGFGGSNCVLAFGRDR